MSVKKPLLKNIETRLSLSKPRILANSDPSKSLELHGKQYVNRYIQKLRWSTISENYW